MHTESASTEAAYSALPQKAPITTATEDVSSQPSGSRDLSRISGKLFDVLLACALITIPMTLFPLVLLYLVFRYQVHQAVPLANNLDLLGNSTDSGHYYVDISATTLVFVASWSSTVSLTLVSSVMLLVSYPVSRALLGRSHNRDVKRLPTPYQLTLLVDLLRGEIMSIWRGLRYLLTWEKTRSELATSVLWPSAILCSVIILRYTVTLIPHRW